MYCVSIDEQNSTPHTGPCNHSNDGTDEDDDGLASFPMGESRLGHAVGCSDALLCASLDRSAVDVETLDDNHRRNPFVWQAWRQHEVTAAQSSSLRVSNELYLWLRTAGRRVFCFSFEELPWNLSAMVVFIKKNFDKVGTSHTAHESESISLSMCFSPRSTRISFLWKITERLFSHIDR